MIRVLSRKGCPTEWNRNGTFNFHSCISGAEQSETAWSFCGTLGHGGQSWLTRRNSALS